MKKLYFTLLALLGFGAAAMAQAPAKFNYQAAVRNNTGNPVPSGTNVSFRFSIFDAAPGGTLLYQETQAKVTNNSAGLVTLEVGGGTPTSGTFPTANQWASGAKYFKVEMDAAGGSNYSDMGTVQLVSVPYAQHANSAAMISAANPTGSGDLPLAYLFQSGTQNPDRWVYQHSPAYPTWGLMYHDTDDVWEFRGGSAANVISMIPWTNSMGIGTRSPYSNLHINGGGAVYSRFTNSTTGSTSGDGSLFGVDASGNTNIINNENSDVVFNINGAEKMRLHNNAALTLGTATSTFSFNMHSSNPLMHMTSASTGEGFGKGLYVGFDDATGNAIMWNWENAYLKFGTSGLERMRILGNGNIGIGTASPSSMLHITGTTTTRDIILTSGGSASQAAIGWSGNTNTGIFSPAASTVAITTAGTERIRIASDGHLLFGTTTNSYPVYFSHDRSSSVVNVMVEHTGTAYAGMGLRNTSNGSGVNLYATNATTALLNVTDKNGSGYTGINASAFNVVSDRTLKKDITSLGTAQYDRYLDMIRNIESATYRYNWEDNGSRPVEHIGVIAQTLPSNLQAVIDEKPDGSSGVKKMGYSLADMDGLTILGIKALDEKVKALEALVAEQQKLIEQLKAQSIK